MTFFRMFFSLALITSCVNAAPAQEQKFVIRQPSTSSAPAEAAPPLARSGSSVTSAKTASPVRSAHTKVAASHVASVRPSSRSDMFILASPERTGLVLHKPPSAASNAASARYVLSTDEIFEEAKDSLTAAGQARLNSLVPALRRLYGHPIEVICHSDHLGFESYNQDLTTRLAQRVKSWIIAHGLAESNQITAAGVGSSRPIAPENLANGRDNAAGRARNRRVEILIQPKVEEPEEKEVTVPSKPDENTATSMDLPPEMQKGLIDMVPVSEQDLEPQFVGTGNEKPNGRSVNQDEWGGGGSNFGNAVSPIGSAFSGYGGGQSEFNQDGKRVVKITPEAEKQEQLRKERVEAQNEFGLWRDR